MRHLCVIEEMLLVDVFDLDTYKIVAYGTYMHFEQIDNLLTLHKNDYRFKSLVKTKIKYKLYINVTRLMTS